MFATVFEKKLAINNINKKLLVKVYLDGFQSIVGIIGNELVGKGSHRIGGNH